MRKSFKFKLFNNRKTYKKLNTELHVFCSVYNHTLALIKRHYKLFGKNPNKYILQKHLTRLMNRGNKPKWKSLEYSQGIQNVTDRIYESYDAFFNWCKKRTGPKKLPPKFKAFRKYRSFTLKQSGWKLEQDKGIIKIGKRKYRYNKSRTIEGAVKTVTIKRDQLGDWYVILSCDLGESYKSSKVAPMTGKSAGFDFGLSCFLTSSENTKIQSPEVFKNSLKELRTKSKALSSKVKGSKNRYKAKKVVARLHKKISNQRQDFHFKLAHDLVHKYDYLFFEDLNLDAMKRLWGRKVSDLGHNKFMERIIFKAQEQGKVVQQISKFYPSSKTCSKCSNIKEGLCLSERRFNCQCGHSLDRDLNAAINILTVGASTVRLDSVTRELALASVV